MLSICTALRVLVLSSLGVGTAVACHAQRATDRAKPAKGATCYQAIYEPDSLAPRFPAYVAMDPGRDSGKAHWLRARADTVRLWPIIYEGRWTHAGPDSLRVRFGYFVDVLLQVVQRADSLIGTATWTPDWNGEAIVHGSVAAFRTPCAQLLK